VLLTAGAAGGVVGSLLASKISTRIGPGTSLFVSLLGGALTYLVTGLTSSAAVVWVMFALWSFLAVVWNVITVSLRQAIIPDRLLGRVNSVYRFFAWGMMPIGSVLGGAIVTVTEVAGSRDLALRMPFFVAGAVFAALYLYALPRLNTAEITAAREAAEATDPAH
jgi:MFS family permease